MYMLDFGERLRALRKEKGYTQKVIAEKNECITKYCCTLGK